MLRIGIFCLLAPFALIEMFLYHRYDIVLVGTLYFALSVQADFAAGRYLREMLVAKETPPSPGETEELHVPPLGAARAKAEPVREVPPPRPAASLHEAPTLTDNPMPPRGRRGVERIPNFRGRAHEVRGIGENAATRTIVNAFRHWIKHFHPDRARDLAPELANARVRKLTEAKELLLERRRGRRAA